MVGKEEAAYSKNRNGPIRAFPVSGLYLVSFKPMLLPK